MEKSGPLDGLLVLDLTRVLAGPFATMILGDLGATILKIEDPKEGDTTRHSPPFQHGQSHYYLTFGRNKKSIALDLTTREGLEIVKGLCRKADVLIENFRPGTLERLGLDEATLRELNPEMIVCRVSGFGQTGPLRDRIAYDVISQAMSGVLSTNGETDGPPVRLGIPVGDMAGGLYATIAILASLWGRDRGYAPRPIDLALHDALLSMLGYMTALYDMTGTTPGRPGSRHPSIVPYGTFQTKDGWLALSVFTTKFFVNFCKAIGRPDVAADSRYKRTKERMTNRAELEALVESILLERSTAEWDALFQSADVPASAILSVAGALDHAHTGSRTMYRALTHPAYGSVRVAGSPLRLGKNAEDPAPPPLHGEDTETVLHDLLGVGTEEIRRLEAAGVLKVARAADGSTP